MRAFGFAVVLIGAILVWVGVSGLWRTTEMAETLAMLSRTEGEAFDTADWAFRWRLSAALMCALGLVALVAGCGLVRRRRWGLTAWASLVAAVVLLQITTQVLDLPAYAFEETGRVELAVAVLVAVVSWAAVWQVQWRVRRAAKTLAC